MAQLNNARQWQRFAYPADVALATDFDSAEPQVVAALAVDLSLGGMQLLAANAPRVGAAIRCKFPNDHSELQLRGFVRWSSPAPSPGTQFQSRVGVEFEPLSSMARQVVQALISHAERAGELVRVQLPNWPFTLQGVAVPSERGVRLHVPLPSIAQGSSVKFMSLSPETQLEGRVLETELTLCRTTQALELSMVLEPREPARRRRYTVYDQPADSQSDSEAALRPALPPSASKPQWHVPLIAAAVLVGGLGWFGAARPVFHMGQHHVALDSAAAKPDSQSRLTPPARASASTSTQVPSETSSQLEAQPSLPEPIAKAAAATDVPAAPLAATEDTTGPTNSRAPEPEVAPQPAAADASPTSDPSFARTDEQVEVLVPLHGSLADVRTAMWADPAALVVDLPSASAALTHARYTTHMGCLLGLSVGRPKGTLQLRVYLSEKVVRYTTSESAGGLSIRVRCTPEAPEQPR